ncbi:hypothetical protein J4440_04125 [Candidatus Woesearchaeota archaeon]|nr:hypothetical protein [Candidatus Woesearchaeota archaeon]
MEIKQKPLLPSLKEKKRYIVFEIFNGENLSFSNVKDSIIQSYKSLFGEIGLAHSGIDFIEYKNQKGILKVGTKNINNIKASFCFIRKINKQDVTVRSLGISGILNKARSKFISGGGL